MKTATSKQIENQRFHVNRAKLSLRRALKAADAPHDDCIMRALSELSAWEKRIR